MAWSVISLLTVGGENHCFTVHVEFGVLCHQESHGSLLHGRTEAGLTWECFTNLYLSNLILDRIEEGKRSCVSTFSLFSSRTSALHASAANRSNG